MAMGCKAASSLFADGLVRNRRRVEARHDPSRLSAALFDRVGPELTVVSGTTFLDPAYAAQLGRILDDDKFGLIP